LENIAGWARPVRIVAKSSFATSTAFDISATLSQQSGLGQWLRALLGYTSRPEWITLGAWLAYVVTVLALYLRPMKAPSPEVRASRKVAGA
jgi:high-affinity Fe2+/Pb2+ permease